jgi:isopentenyl phosphate kinase
MGLHLLSQSKGSVQRGEKINQSSISERFVPVLHGDKIVQVITYKAKMSLDGLYLALSQLNKCQPMSLIQVIKGREVIELCGFLNTKG